MFSNQTKEETKFTYSPLEKAFEKQVNALKPLNVSDKINELKKIIKNSTPDTTPYATPDTTPYATPDTTPQPTTTKIQDFVNKIKNDEERNSEIFNENFGCQNPSFLARDLFEANQIKNNQILNEAIYSINELRNAANNHQKGPRFKILTPKKTLQRLLIALAQVKACNISKNLLNEIRQIVYLCIIQKKILKE